ncbi:MAG: D-alanyl-D-alanine carboxypeptidase, partial [Mangrovicoccus sp.]
MSRRAVLRLLASSGGAAIGNAAWPMVESSPRPKPRPSAAPVFDAKSEIRDLISKANLKGEFGFQVFDLAKGTALDAENPDQTMPPASTAKAITTAYAFDRLGPGHQLSTRVLTNGQIRSGVLEGDLYLIGGGDPTLSSDHLYGLASDIAALGVRRITGKFGIWAGDLPFIPTIDPDQPPQVGYSPAISGLGVNYNRVHFSWARQNNGYDLQFDARTATRRPKTAIATMSLADRALPVFEYHLEAETAQDAWSVARSALGEAGSRWLPVRDPALYAGQVFQSVASEAGISLPAPIILDQSPKGATLATLHSPNFTEMARGLLRYSNNLTAEIMGLTASAADGMMPQNLAQSAMMMNNWA